LALPLAYGLALLLLLAGVEPLGSAVAFAWAPATGTPAGAADPLYPLFAVFAIIVSAMVLLNLWLGLRETPSRAEGWQFTRLLAATLLLCAGLLLSRFGGLLGVEMHGMPALLLADFSVLSGAILMGYTVASSYAREQGRALNRELIYLAFGAGALIVLAVLLVLLLYPSGHTLALANLVVIAVVTISAVALHDGLHAMLDRLFYRPQARRMRANLRAVAHDAGCGLSLSERLSIILRTLCRSLQIKEGMVAVREGDAFVCRAAHDAGALGSTYPLSLLTSETVLPQPRHGSDASGELALLLPVHDGDEQVASLVLGPRNGGEPFSEADLDLLQIVVSELAAVIRACRCQEEQTRALADLADRYHQRERALQKYVLALAEDGQPRPLAHLIGLPKSSPRRDLQSRPEGV
jgi:hypothetical protein